MITGRQTLAPVLGASLALSCASAEPPLAAVAPAPSPAPEPEAPAAPLLPVATYPDIELPEPHAALVRGARLLYSGEPQATVWPALDQSVVALASHGALTIQADRSVPIVDVLRAASAAGGRDVRVQSKDNAGLLRVVELRGRHGAAPAWGCHAAVFVRVDGSLRVASPGGGAEVRGDAATVDLVRALRHESAQCPIKYVAFGAESEEEPWGPVFDLVVAVDKARSAGEARYVLGYPARSSTTSSPPGPSAAAPGPQTPAPLSP